MVWRKDETDDEGVLIRVWWLTSGVGRVSLMRLAATIRTSEIRKNKGLFEFGRRMAVASVMWGEAVVGVLG